jgi:hypothetical protein
MRHHHETDADYDLAAMIARPLYFGMMFNIVIPAALLFGCHYLSSNTYMTNYIPGIANGLLYVFAFLALGQAALALWWRNLLMAKPMVIREASFEYDIGNELLKRSKPVFLLIAAITFWGYAYFLLTGRFAESAIFVVFSFVVFQVVRPRYGSVGKLIRYQRALVDRGHLMGGGLSEIRREADDE